MKSKIDFFSLEKLDVLLPSYINCRWYVLIDQILFEHYPQLAEQLKGAEQVVVVEAGEKLKSITEFAKVTNHLLQAGIRRNDHLVAIGGGTLSDFAGFVAATILRGISWSVVPTTLLAMVDAAIGGKTGINSEWGKNLIGAFHFPQYVFCSVEWLETLPAEELKSGLGEVIKYAFLSDKVASLLSYGLDQQLIKACMDFKLEIVEHDSNEQGKRKILNFGHTFGHAIEKVDVVAHGIAVLLGIKEFFRLQGEQEKLLQLERYLALFDIKLPAIHFTKAHLDFMLKDKKNTDSQISFIDSNAKIIKYSVQDLEKFMQDED